MSCLRDGFNGIKLKIAPHRLDLTVIWERPELGSREEIGIRFIRQTEEGAEFIISSMFAGWVARDYNLQTLLDKNVINVTFTYFSLPYGGREYTDDVCVSESEAAVVANNPYRRIAKTLRANLDEIEMFRDQRLKGIHMLIKMDGGVDLFLNRSDESVKFSTVEDRQSRVADELGWRRPPPSYEHSEFLHQLRDYNTSETRKIFQYLSMYKYEIALRCAASVDNANAYLKENVCVIVRELLKKREKLELNINGKSLSTGETALHIAARKGNRKIYDLLIAAGADVTILNRDGLTAEQVVADYEVVVGGGTGADQVVVPAVVEDDSVYPVGGGGGDRGVDDILADGFRRMMLLGDDREEEQVREERRLEPI